MDDGKLLAAWEESKSIRHAAKIAGCAPKTAMKTLITHGIYPTRRCEEIAHMSKTMTVSQIAEVLNTSTKNVENYLPHTKGSYKTEQKSSNALRIAKFRAKKVGGCANDD